MKLDSDVWTGRSVGHRMTDQPGWADVEQAVRCLDGVRHTQVVLDRGDSHMLVGGGPNRYNLCITTSDDRYLTLLSNAGEGTIEHLVTGGQSGEFPGETVVDLDDVLRALRGFFEDGRALAEVNWREE